MTYSVWTPKDVYLLTAMRFECSLHGKGTHHHGRLQAETGAILPISISVPRNNHIFTDVRRPKLVRSRPFPSPDLLIPWQNHMITDTVISRQETL